MHGGKFAFQNRLAKLVVGRKLFEGKFQVQLPGGLFSEGRFNGGLFALRFWGAYIWRSLF